MADPAPVSNPGKPDPCRLHESLLDAILSGAGSPSGVEPAAAFAEALARHLGARHVILSSKMDGERRKSFGRRQDGSAIGRPDKLVRPEELSRIASATGLAWTVLEEDETRWRAGLRIAGVAPATALLLVDGSGPAPWVPGASPAVAPARIASMAAAAIAIGEMRAENSRLREELARRGGGDPEAAIRSPAPGARALLEYALSGNPVAGSISDVFKSFPEVIGRSAAMGGVLQAALTAARSDIPVLVEGESGTGKEVIARAIHGASRRNRSPFVSENCGAVPESLMESELFGHEKGAFTGAEARKPGLFERGSSGTVFLDEVGEMAPSLQRKLLRVLQEKEIRRVGGQETLPVDFRLLSATNRNLEEMVSAGTFREDLYYRVNVMTISIPALRERQGDVPLLVQCFNERFAEETGRGPIELTSRALEALSAYRWPGNVRELRNEIWSLSCSGRAIVDVEHLSARILRGLPSEEDREGASSPPPPLYEVERGTMGALILDALRRARGNRAEAARRLGITRASLYRRMAKYKLLDDRDWKPRKP